jgi:hypothetical protein
MIRAWRQYNQYLHQYVEPLVGTGVTDDHQLIRAGNRLLGQNFAGVVASDQIPDISSDPMYLIVNLDKHDRPGSHWVAICVSGGRMYFYDSFGRTIDSIMPSAIQFADSNDLPIIGGGHNAAEQDVHEQDCGARCLAWLLLAKRHGTKVASCLIV